MRSLEVIKELVQKFDQNKESYLSPSYNEAQLRIEFLDPFFEALGWDVTNKQGLAEAYKEVIHEDAVKVGSATKAPDYSFRIGGVRKFFVEAKKPSIDIHDDPSPAFQLRRYAWSAKLPLSILTDFQEFAVYDCRLKPAVSDKPSAGRVAYFKFTDYESRWDSVLSAFSKDALLRGAFDKFAAESKAKKGTAEVDDAFLEEIEKWRDDLAHNLARRNPQLTQPELNFAVQRTIDRLVFLRICEDRGMENYGKLLGCSNGENVYKRLCASFREADDRYNSGLFHFRQEKERDEAPDGLTLSLGIDDKVLKDLIRRMYYPESPYEFSVLPADILGQVIRLTEGHQARIEDKPEVKKAGGVYYTPTYIVEYIVKNTLGKLLDGKSPKEATKIRVLDPACGSGSFLIGAYQFLLDWHRDWYIGDDSQKWARGKAPALYQTRANEFRLTAAERKRILLNSIYGVDIDTQAVEVTKLSLLLKVLEGENEESINQQLRLFHERALPDLGRNIKCGNSLIAPDFGLSEAIDPIQINTFDWQSEFSELLRGGGFDVVLGNPPYVRIQGFPKAQVEYLTTHYQAATGNCDIYVSFVERGCRLLRKGGRMGFILPNKFFRTDYGTGLRGFLSGRRAVHRIVDFQAGQVFSSATTYTCLLFLGGEAEAFEHSVSEPSAAGLAAAAFSKRKADELTSLPWSLADSRHESLLAKLQTGTVRLLEVPSEMSRGSSTGCDEVFIIEDGQADIERDILRRPIFASNFGRYRFNPRGNQRVIFPFAREGTGFRPLRENELREQFPKAFAYLRENAPKLRKRKQFRDWFGWSAARNLEIHERASLLVPLLADHGLFAAIPDNVRGKVCLMAGGGFSITTEAGCAVQPEFILALLNSKLLFWRLRGLSNLFRGGWITCTKQYFGELPIRLPDLSRSGEREAHDRLVELARQMISMNLSLADTRLEHEQHVITRRIAATDVEIDRIVYEYYGLNEAEIKLVNEVTDK